MRVGWLGQLRATRVEWAALLLTCCLLCSFSSIPRPLPGCHRCWPWDLRSCLSPPQRRLQILKHKSLPDTGEPAISSTSSLTHISPPFPPRQRSRPGYKQPGHEKRKPAVPHNLPGLREVLHARARRAGEVRGQIPSLARALEIQQVGL